MLLAVDIGNTNITVGVFKFGKEKLLHQFRLSTILQKTSDEYQLSLESLLEREKIKLGGIKVAVICSVVPAVTNSFKELISKKLGIPTYIIGKDLKVPLENLYRNPKQVGQDRLVNAYAAVKYYAAPLVVVDFGTAITFDIVSRNKEYMGGMIVPGIEISLKALWERAALLPKIELIKPEAIIGKDTAESMRSGIFYGFSSLVDGTIDKIQKKFTKKLKVVATGGQAKFIAEFCKRIDAIDTDLTLKGIYLTYSSTS